MKTPAIDSPVGREVVPAGNAVVWMAGGLFALLLAAWTTLIILARHHPVETVPVTAPADKR